MTLRRPGSAAKKGLPYMYFLYDFYPERKGENRFEITAMPIENKRLICTDKYINNLKRSEQLLLDNWERVKVPEKRDTPVPEAFLCVTRHSRRHKLTVYEPWYQIKSEVIKRGYEFFD